MQIPESVSGRFYVYEHIRHDTGKIFYVGKGTGFRATVSSRFHRNLHWQRIAAKAGGFSARKVIDGICEELALFIECELIDKLRKCGVVLCNMTDGGDGVSGRVITDECRKKIGNAHRGKIVSQETREKISVSVKTSGYVPSQEAREKMSAAHRGKQRSKGYRHTDEWKKRASMLSMGNKSRLGQKRSEEERRKSSEKLTGRIQGKLECPKCGKIGGNAMKRWHFDNCKIGA